MEKVKHSIQSIDGVEGVHDLHAWSVDGEYNVMTVHVVLLKAITMEEQQQLKLRIREKLYAQGIQHCTIEFEQVDEECGMEPCC